MVTMFRIGCHISAAGGYLAMGKKAAALGANTFAFFTRNPRGGASKALDEDDVAAFLDFAAEHDVDISSFTEAGNSLVGTISRLIPSNLNGIINTSVNIGVAVFNSVISFILAIYFLLDKERILRTFSRLLRVLLPRKQFSETMTLGQRSNSILVRYVAFDLLDGIIIGVANYIFMTIFGMQYAVLISVVCGLTNLAPTFGPILGAVIGAFILVLVEPWHALWFLVFTLVLQLVDGYILKPRLFGGTLGVPSVWILVTIIIGGRVFGVPGILLSIPFAAIVSFLVHDFITMREAQIAAPAAAPTEESKHAPEPEDERHADP